MARGGERSGEGWRAWRETLSSRQSSVRYRLYLTERRRGVSRTRGML